MTTSAQSNIDLECDIWATPATAAGRAERFNNIDEEGLWLIEFCAAMGFGTDGIPSKRDQATADSFFGQFSPRSISRLRKWIEGVSCFPEGRSDLATSRGRLICSFAARA